MKVIGIDTSGTIGSVAAVEGNSKAVERSFTRGLHHGVELIPTLEEACREAGWTVHEANLIAVSLGPGSYTGIRIGVATVKALAYAGKMEVIGIPTLDALAENGPEKNPLVCTVLDAKRGNLYTCLYRFTADRKKRLWPYSVRKPQEVAQDLPEGAFIVGEGVHAYGDLLLSQRSDLALGRKETWQVRASIVARLGKDAFLSGKRDDPLTLTPLYLKPSEAERGILRREENQKN